jgi:O-antigen chain-terminating methyltransferase
LAFGESIPAWSEAVVLDVDGNVVSPEELVRRVEQLVRRIGPTSQSPGSQYPGDSRYPAIASKSVEPELDAMRITLADIRPPDLPQPRGPRGRAVHFVKRVVRKLTRWYVEPRLELQRRFDEYSVEFATTLHNYIRQVDSEIHEREQRDIALDLQVLEAVEKQERWLSSIPSQDDVDALRREVAIVLQRLGLAAATGANIDYAAFEDRFRGSQSEIHEAQERYVTLFSPGPGTIVDIGCGRGEMLEVLLHAGHEAIGVDSDPTMIEACRAKSLPAIQDDGIHWLERAAENSLKGIFCAQVIEHLLTSELEHFVRLAQSKLQVNGVLVMETINPRSLFALGNHFFADTSHVRPVHPETLRFICEQVGFERVELEERSRHPMVDLAEGLPDDQVGSAIEALLKSVFGYQDYVIVATK